jgi:hypothetical protein
MAAGVFFLRRLKGVLLRGVSAVACGPGALHGAIFLRIAGESAGVSLRVFCEGLIEPSVISGVNMIGEEIGVPCAGHFAVVPISAGEVMKFAIHDTPPTVRFDFMDEVADENRLFIPGQANFIAVSDRAKSAFQGVVAKLIDLVLSHLELLLTLKILILTESHERHRSLPRLFRLSSL